MFHILGITFMFVWPGRIAQSVARPTEEPEVPGSITVSATYFRRN